MQGLRFSSRASNPTRTMIADQVSAKPPAAPKAKHPSRIRLGEARIMTSAIGIDGKRVRLSSVSEMRPARVDYEIGRGSVFKDLGCTMRMNSISKATLRFSLAGESTNSDSPGQRPQRSWESTNPKPQPSLEVAWRNFRETGFASCLPG